MASDEPPALVIHRWLDVDDALPAPFPNDRVGRVLVPIVYGGLAALLFVIAVAWRVAEWVELAALAGEAVALGGALGLIGRRRIRLAVWLMVLAFVLASSAVVLSFGSMRTVGSFGFMFAVILTAVFLPRRDIAAVLAIVWTAVAALTWVEVTRVAQPPLRPFGWPHAIMLSVGFLFVTFVVGYARNVAVSAVRLQLAELTERQRAEERLRLSMEATRQGWFDLDLTTGLVASSDQFARLIGGGGVHATSGQMTRESWIAAIHRDDRAQVMARFDRCLRLEETEQMDYRLMGLDGAFRWIRSTAKVVEHDSEGRPLRMTGTHADITEQMATTLALESSERSYRALVEMSPVGVMVVRDGTVRYANPAAVTMLRATNADGLLGVALCDVATDLPATWPASPNGKASDGSDAAPVPAELLLRRVDGSTFEASMLCTSVMHEGAPSLHLSFTDISAQKSAEEARLTSRQLEALGTLAGGIAHDFNNILLAIRGNAELVASEGNLSAQAAEPLREILLAGQRASELVRRITTFARPREPRQQHVDLREVLHEVMRLLRPTIPAGISLVVRTDEDVAPILADAAEVHETIVNLTANAVYAIGSSRVGEITFTIDSTHLAGDAAIAARVAEGRYTRLTVRDTGRGMSSDTQRRIFDAFYTTKPVGEGTGLGLSMAYGTMRRHGGAIRVESREGDGTTFWLLFPSAESAAPALPEEPTAVLGPQRQLRVLFVDDEPQLTRLAHRTLGPLGHAVTSFNSPREALETFRATPHAFDVVVTDLSMPQMSGLDLSRSLRLARSDIPILMVTGYANETDEAEARSAGVTRLAIKAADAGQLPRLLAEVLQSTQAAD